MPSTSRTGGVCSILIRINDGRPGLEAVHAELMPVLMVTGSTVTCYMRMRPLVLLVNDTLDQLDLYEMAFADRDTILRATTGDARTTAAVTERPDAIIFDVLMPRQDAFATCAQLKDHRVTAGIPVLLLTASDATDVEARTSKGRSRLRAAFRAATCGIEYSGGRHGVLHRSCARCGRRTGRDFRVTSDVTRRRSGTDAAWSRSTNLSVAPVRTLPSPRAHSHQSPREDWNGCAQSSLSSHSSMWLGF